MPVSQSTLNEESRSKLDGIVSKMQENGESEDNIRFVVDDFKAKYSEKKNESLPSKPSAAPLQSPAQGTDDRFSFDKVLNPNKQEGNAPLPQPVTPKVAPKKSEKYLEANWMTAADPQSLKEKPEGVAPIKSAATGFASVISSSLKSIAIAAKRYDFFNEYTDKKTEDLVTYKAGKWVDDTVKDLVGEATPEQQAQFGTKLFTAVGQMSGFMLGGLGGKVMKMSPALTTAALGAAVGGASEYEAAVQSGATEDQAAKAFWINAALNTTEGLPFMSMFRKMDKYTGGLATGLLAKKLSSTVGGRLTNEIAGGIAGEVAQEVGVQALSNVTAANTYDATRKWYDGLVETGGISAIIGGSMSGVAVAIRNKRMQGGLTKQEDAQLAAAEQFAQEKADEALDPNKESVSTPTAKSEKVKSIVKAKTDLEADLAHNTTLPEDTKAAMQSEVSALDEELEVAKEEVYQQELDSKEAKTIQADIDRNLESIKDETLSESTKALIQKQIQEDTERLQSLNVSPNDTSLEQAAKPTEQVTNPLQQEVKVPGVQNDKEALPNSTNEVGQGEPTSTASVLEPKVVEPSTVKEEEAWDKEGMTKGEYEAIYGKEGDAPYVEVTPKVAVEPSKPVSEMNSEELYEYAQSVKKELKNNSDENLIDNVAELKDASVAVNFVENAENINDLASSIKGLVSRMGEKPSDYDLAVLNAAKNKAVELNIDPSDLMKEVLKRTAKDFKDANDAEFMMQNVLEKLIPKNEETKTNELSNTKKEISATNEAVGSNIGKAEKATREGSGGGKEPPVVDKAEESEPSKFKSKRILNRLYNAEKVPDISKKGFEEKGLKYEPQTQKEAESIGKGIVDEYGIDEAITLAEAAKFRGGVNSAIFAESLNRLFIEEQNAKTPEAKLKAAKDFADIGIRYDEFSRSQGRDIKQISHFYKKSPLGIKIMEETRRGEAFEEFTKNKNQSWKEFFDEMMKEPDFEKEVQTKVSSDLKKERAEARAKRIKKVDDIFDAAIKKLNSGGATYSSFIPVTPKTVALALEGMKKAYHAGEKVVKIVEDAIDYITKETGGGWDKEKFRSEWNDKLGEHEAPKELPKDKKEKILERYRKKLKGLNEKQKDEVIRKAFKKLIENGALEYDDFKKIIADTIGYGEITAEQAKKITDLVEKMNAVEDLATNAREGDRNEEALKKYQQAKKEAEKSATELGKIVFNKVDLVKRFLSIMQLNTLGLASLVNNPIFNVFNQATVRLPRSLVMTAMDFATYGVGKLAGKDILPENNVVLAQREFYKKLGYGSRQSVEQLFTGLTNKDYFQKEVYASQIHPVTSMNELWDFAKGKTSLTAEQVIDKTMQSLPFMGVPAEIVARVLNIGDKPQRFAAEGAQAATFANNLGLQGIDYKLFMEFPKEEAYRKYKKDGLSDDVALKKAEEIQQRIINEGEESTFQQDNLLNDAITAAFKPFGKVGEVVKTLNMPFVKIPLNAFWSVFNLANPEVALLQSVVYAGRAMKSKSSLDIQNSKKWFAHAVTGMAWMAVTGALANAGIINPANDDETTKKEREGEQNYAQQNTINVTKLQAYLNGENPDEVKTGLLVDTKWFGNMGILMGYQAQKLENMTPEQKEKGVEYMEDMLNNLKESSLDFMDKGVFSNTGALFTAIDKGGSFMDAYLINLMNMGANAIQPATFAQISRAQLPYYSKVKSETFLGQVENSALNRSSFLRKALDKYPPSKVGIWGDPVEKKDNVAMRLFGISRQSDDNFAQPIYDDYKKTNDTRFFPSAVKPEIRENGVTQKLNIKEAFELETLVGQARKNLVAPYINDMAKFKGSMKTYSQLSDNEKIEKLQILYDLGYESGKQKFIIIHPEYKAVEPLLQEKRDKDKKQDANEVLRENLKNKLKLNR